jgi:hypothetical protein
MSTLWHKSERWVLGAAAIGIGLVVARLAASASAMAVVPFLLFALAIVNGIAKTGTA